MTKEELQEKPITLLWAVARGMKVDFDIQMEKEELIQYILHAEFISFCETRSARREWKHPLLKRVERHFGKRIFKLVSGEAQERGVLAHLELIDEHGAVSECLSWVSVDAARELGWKGTAQTETFRGVRCDSFWTPEVKAKMKKSPYYGGKR